MDQKLSAVLIEKINWSLWWHVPPQDTNAYRKRGKFLAPTYNQAAFYGRPSNEPERVFIKNPVFGSEREILKKLFPENHKNLENVVLKGGRDWYEKRIEFDAKIFKKAKKMGYDSIVLLGSNGRKCLTNGRKPHSIELNLLYL